MINYSPPPYNPPPDVAKADGDHTSNELAFWAACRSGASVEEKIRLAEHALCSACVAAILRRREAPAQLVQVTDARYARAEELQDQAYRIPLERRICATLCVDHLDGYELTSVREIGWVSPPQRAALFDRATALYQAVETSEAHHFLARERASQAERNVVEWETMLADLLVDAAAPVDSHGAGESP